MKMPSPKAGAFSGYRKGRCKLAGGLAIKLLAIDLDYTLLDNEVKVPKRAEEAIRAAVSLGAMVTLASGRMYKATLPFAEALDLDVPLITYNGALIKTSRSKEVYHFLPVPLGLAIEVLRYAKEQGLHANVYLDDEIYVDEMNWRVREYAERAKVTPFLVEDLLEFVDREPTKLLLLVDEEVIDSHVEALGKRFFGRLRVSKSMPTYIELTNWGASKGQALSVLAGRLGIRREEVMAIGDSGNDMDMLEYAGLGVAVANAYDFVKARADFVTAGEDGEGVAEAIEAFILRRCRTSAYGCVETW